MLRIERLTERDVVGYQEIRLEGLRAHPSFSAHHSKKRRHSPLARSASDWLEASSSAALTTTACKA